MKKDIVYFFFFFLFKEDKNTAPTNSSTKHGGGTCLMGFLPQVDWFKFKRTWDKFGLKNKLITNTLFLLIIFRRKCTFGPYILERFSIWFLKLISLLGQSLISKNRFYFGPCRLPYNKKI